MSACVAIIGCDATESDEDEREQPAARDSRDGGTLRDAGERDAGRRDAGERDAGERDVGRADAMTPLDGSTAGGASVLDGGLADGSLRSDAAPTLRELIDTFFVPTCVLGRCHTTLAPAGDLSLTDRNISVYEALVNAPSSEVPERMRVVPFDPSASYLMEKLESDEPAVGTRMPPPFAVLPPEQIERVRAWIRAGAARD